MHEVPSTLLYSPAMHCTLHTIRSIVAIAGLWKYYRLTL